jgi:hypothetical protein
MNSADAWHESNDSDIGRTFEVYLEQYNRTVESMMDWPADPDGDMVPILERSVEAAKQRHPSAQSAPPLGPVVIGQAVMLDKLDRCDHCGSEAVYRVAKSLDTDPMSLDFCLHHWRKNFPPMVSQGWATVGGNPSLLAEMGQEALDYGHE